MSNARTRARIAGLSVLALALAASASAQVADWRQIVKPPLRAQQVQEPKRIVFGNGVVLFLQEDRELPLIAGRIVVRGGSREEPADKVGLVDLYGEAWRTGGTKSQTGDQLDDFLELRAAKVETDSDEDSTEIGWDSLKDDFDAVFAVAVDLLRNPEFRAEKLVLAKNQANTAIARRNDDIMGIARREARRLGYGKESPYARIPEYDSIAAVTRDDLVAWHKKTVHPNNLIVAVRGDFDPKAMEARIKKALGSLPRGPRFAAATPAPAPAKPGVYFVEKGDVTQSQIALLHRGIRRDDPDYYAVQVLNEVFGGGFAARLFSNIRTQKGLAYSVGGGVGAQYDYPGLFTVAMGTKSESTAAAIEALHEEIDKIQAAKVSDEELARAKEAILNSFVFSYDSKAKILNQKALLEFYGYPLDFLERYRAAVDKVSADQVWAAAKKHIRKNELAILVVGKSAAFDAPLSKFGAVTPIDIAIPAPGAREAKAPVAASDAGKELAKRALGSWGDAAKMAAVIGVHSQSTATMKTPQGEMAIEAEEWIVFPDRRRQLLKTPMGEMAMVLTPEAAFAAAPMGVRDLPESQRKSTLDELRTNPFAVAKNLASASYVFALAGKEKVGEIEAEIVEIRADGATVRWFVDPATGKVLRTSRNVAEGPQVGTRTVDLSDWKEFAGFTVPTRSVVRLNGEEISTVTTKSWDPNPTLDPAAWQKPAP